jgi:hypothetical protein
LNHVFWELGCRKILYMQLLCMGAISKHSSKVQDKLDQRAVPQLRVAKTNAFILCGSSMYCCGVNSSVSSRVIPSWPSNTDSNTFPVFVLFALQTEQRQSEVQLLKSDLSIRFGCALLFSV